VLLGIPEEDREQVRGLAGVLFDVTASSARDKARRGFALYGYMAKLLRRKAENPSDDVLSGLAIAHTQGTLSHPEVIDLSLALLTAGYETTVGQLSLSLLALLTDPVVVGELSERTVRGLVEEYLRLTPSAPMTFPRVATEDVDLGGVTIKAGQAVMVSVLHANRDTAVFTEPELVNVEGRPTAHLTFAHGPHYCLGAPLARLQLTTALRKLTARFPDLRIADRPDAVEWLDGYATRGLTRLLVVCR
jgi:cytochrome P450